MNQLKNRAKTIQIERIIKALGRDKTIELLREIDAKVPGGKSTFIDNTKLNDKELTQLKECHKGSTWKEISVIFNNTKNPQPAYAKLSYRYLHHIFNKQ